MERVGEKQQLRIEGRVKGRIVVNRDGSTFNTLQSVALSAVTNGNEAFARLLGCQSEDVVHCVLLRGEEQTFD